MSDFVVTAWKKKCGCTMYRCIPHVNLPGELHNRSSRLIEEGREKIDLLQQKVTFKWSDKNIRLPIFSHISWSKFAGAFAAPIHQAFFSSLQGAEPFRSLPNLMTNWTYQVKTRWKNIIWTKAVTTFKEYLPILLKFGVKLKKCSFP